MRTIFCVVILSSLLAGCATPVQNLAAGVVVGAVGSSLLRPRYYEAPPRYYYEQPRCFWRHGRQWCER